MQRRKTKAQQRILSQSIQSSPIRIGKVLLFQILGIQLFCSLPAIAAEGTDLRTSATAQRLAPKIAPPITRAIPGQRMNERQLARRNLWFPIYVRNHTPLNPTKTKSLVIETQIAEGTPMNLPPGWQDNLSLGDETVENNKQSQPNENISQKVHELTQGSILIHQQKDTTIHSAGHNIFIKAGSIVYVVRLNKELALYNLSGKQQPPVTIKSDEGQRSYDLRSGRAVFLIGESDFENSKLSKFIVCSQPSLLTSDGKVNVYETKFSFLSALDRCPQFQGCVNSTNENQRRLANKILKISAARIVTENR